jgi:hypothetical protein
VFIRRGPVSGDVVLSRKPESWDGFLALAGDPARVRELVRLELKHVAALASIGIYCHGKQDRVIGRFSRRAIL